MGKSLSDKKIGAVLVIGGGIAGMQTSLDLVEAGLKVYLLEKEVNIGGVMAQLDKTFPTDDCAMCTMAPRLVDVGRNPNIEIITNSELVRVEGEEGNFDVIIKRNASKIDPSKCTGCGACAQVCPIELMDEYNEGLLSRNAIYMKYAQAVPKTYAIERETPRCEATCPAGTKVREYINLIADGRFDDALAKIRETLPLPGVCGRICHHPCEAECKRNYIDEPINIRDLKRFVADYELKQKSGDQAGAQSQKPEFNGKRVAIIGSGPSGLTAAHDLARLGYGVTIYERLPVAGGMLRVGIPEYRLPRDILQYEIDLIKDMGVEIRLNTEIGKEISLDQLKDHYDAILLAVGTPLPKVLSIPGAELDGIYLGLEFLQDVAIGNEIKLGKKVLVIGGGNVAIDCARSALRLGVKEVEIACLESWEEMPAHPWEVKEALEEGIKIHTRKGPKRFLGNGRVEGLECLGVKAVFDKKGRFAPTFYEDTAHTIEADTIIVAIGQTSDLAFVEGMVEIERGLIKVDPDTLQTSQTGIFASGDVITGPASAVEAISAGHEAAISIDRYLKGEDLGKGRLIKPRFPKFERFLREELKRKHVEGKSRIRPEHLEVEKRIKDFSEFELGYIKEMAIKEAKRCLSCRKCLGCGICKEECEAEAIIYEAEDEVIKLNVGAIILCPGFDEFDPSVMMEFGYTRYRNVVTSIEFERMLSASGPLSGIVYRPSDGDEPKRIAFIQCIGSRDKQNHYCSSVCCMYATKEAMIAKDHASHHLECSIFFMDVRAYGKGFEEYYNRAKDEFGVRYIRSRPSSIVEDPKTKNLIIRYETEEGESVREEYDLVVLSIGLNPPRDLEELSKVLGIELKENGFLDTDIFTPVETTKPGIYVCGAAQGPKDIPETVAQASGAAAKAMGLLYEAKGSLIEERILPEERDVSGEEPRIGVFVCHCGINIGGVVDVPGIVEYAKTLPNVVYAEENLYTCSQDTQERIKSKIEEEGLNRVIVASCTPRTHQPMFRQTCREAGLNKYLFEMANIRDQCSWVHSKEPDRATSKANILVKMAVAKARTLEPLEEAKTSVNPKALVIGGGITGMVAALDLANQGYLTYLIEKERELGGNARHISSTLDGRDIQKYLRDLIDKVEMNPLINIFKGAQIKQIEGYVGNFKTELQTPDSKLRTVEHGVIIVATGAKEHRPTEYLYGQDDRVITQRELEEKLTDHRSPITDYQTIVMIQCVGSRDEERPYCSRVCCQEAIKNALRIKDMSPDTQIYILYRDIRTYGLKEEYYKKAREAGVVFIRYDEERKPELRRQKAEGREQIEVSVFDPILRERLILNPDLVVLSTAIVANEGNEELAKMLKVPLTKEKFFLEAHVKLRPVDFANDGVFVAGLAHSPKLIDESISQASGAVARASTILSKDEVFSEGSISVLKDDSLCRGCEKCKDGCEFNAIEMVDYIDGTMVSKINPILCKGCGACAAICQAGAIIPLHFASYQINAMVEAALVSDGYKVS